ncbi:MAG TPA: hypothetical protein VGF45_10245 [Polyangia bacterium]
MAGESPAMFVSRPRLLSREPSLSRVLCLCAWVAAGCGGGSDSAESVPAPDGADPRDGGADTGAVDSASNVDSPADAGRPDVDLERAITGAYRRTSVRDDMTVHGPRDLAGREIGVWAGADGRQYVSGQGFADGTFVVPEVPGGPFLFDFRPSFAILAASAGPVRRFDLGFAILGHPDWFVTPSAKAGTAIELTVTGLLPWRSGDQVRVETDTGLSQQFSSGVALDATAGFARLTYGSAVDGPGRGHETVFKQWGFEQTSAGIRVRTARAAATTREYKTVDGEVTKFTQALVALPVDDQIRLDVRRSQFRALVSGLILEGGEPTVAIAATRLPAAMTEHSGRALTAFIDVPAGAGDVTVDVMTTNPYPPSWLRILDVAVTIPTSISIPGAMAPHVGTQGMRVRDVASQLGASPVVPIIGPVRAVTVDRRAAPIDAALIGVGDQPTVAWSPPDLGRARIYELAVYRLDVRVDRTTEVLVATLVTEGTSVILPGRLLDRGAWYRAVVRALDAEAPSVTAPQRVARTLAESWISTGRFTP